MKFQQYLANTGTEVGLLTHCTVLCSLITSYCFQFKLNTLIELLCI